MAISVRRLSLFGTLAALVLTIVPAHGAPGDCRLIRGAETAEDPADDVSVCRQDTWIHQADSKAGNLAGFGQGKFPSWNTTAPTASVTAGAGGGYAGASVFHQVVGPYDQRGTAVFDGTYTGNLENLAVSLYAFVPARSTAAGPALAYKLEIDGETLYASGAADRPPTTAGGNAVLKFNFAFTDVYEALELVGKQGDATTVHTIRLSVAPWFIVNDNMVIVYDTTEVPSGIIFNVEDAGLNGYQIVDLVAEE